MSAARAPSPALAAVAAKALVSLLVVAGGFHALSDDDFARVVIAQEFAAAPRLDPSGTSWLPLPFWALGAAHGALGPEPGVSRWATIALGVAGIALLYAAARAAGVSRAGAALGAAAAGAFPYAAVLGVAMVPEGWTAALVGSGALAVASPAPRWRVAGGLALGAATLCRYEAWPVAAGFAALCLVDAARGRGARAPLGLAAALALGGMAAWMLHGLLHHGSAMFFVERVAAYRRAVGAAGADTWSRLVGYPGALLRCEPEVMALALPGVWLGAAGPRWPRSVPPSSPAAAATGAPLPGATAAEYRARWARPALLAALLVVFLVVGDLRDGAPTHHGERALLAVWVGLCVAGADGWARAFPALAPGQRRAWLAGAAAAAVLAALVVRPWYARRDAFADRRAEVAAGAALGARLAPGERALVWTGDYGFYAVMAGAGSPRRVQPLVERDPRAPRPEPDGPAALRGHLEAAGARWVVVPADREGWLSGVAAVEARPAGFLVARRH